MTTVHDINTCRAERRTAIWTGAWCGAALALIVAGVLGAWLAGWQERSYERQFALVRAQHAEALRVERARVARYAEIDALAQAYDAMGER